MKTIIDDIGSCDASSCEKKELEQKDWWHIQWCEICCGEKASKRPFHSTELLVDAESEEIDDVCSYTWWQPV